VRLGEQLHRYPCRAALPLRVVKFPNGVVQTNYEGVIIRSRVGDQVTMFEIEGLPRPTIFEASSIELTPGGPSKLDASKL